MESLDEIYSFIVGGWYSLENRFHIGDNAMIKEIEEKDIAECELNNLCVIPQYRHRGIGEELLKHAFNFAKKLKCNKVNIGIVEENTVLKDWYESLGFVHTGTQKFDFFPFTCGYMVKEL